jgi:hypothetical protein
MSDDHPYTPADPIAPVDDGQLHTLDPRVIEVERLGGGLGVGCLTLVGGGAAVVVMVQLLGRPLALAAVGLAVLGLVGLAAWGAWAWPPLAFRHQWYRLDERGLEIRRGVLWRRVLFVPRSRIQHTDVNQGPIERHYGLAHLVVHTAGTVSASVRLEGLEQDTAVRIRNRLVRVDDDDAV